MMVGTLFRLVLLLSIPPHHQGTRVGQGPDEGRPLPDLAVRPASSAPHHQGTRVGQGPDEGRPLPDLAVRPASSVPNNSSRKDFRVRGGTDRTRLRVQRAAESQDGRWLNWAVWSACSVSCDIGTRSRSRQCQPPSNGGLACTGSDIETVACQDGPCLEVSQWGAWGVWTACSVTCDGGSRLRLRSCDVRSDGRAGCAGRSVETETCSNGACPGERTKLDACNPPWRIHYDRWRKKNYCYTDWLSLQPTTTPYLNDRWARTREILMRSRIFRKYHLASAYCLGGGHNRMDIPTKLATPHGHTLDGTDAMFPWDGEDYWIGVEFDVAQGIYVYNDGVPLDTSWLSWSPWDTAGGHPSNGHGNQNCVVINNGKWRSVQCSDKKKFKCEYQYNCTEGWIYNPHVDRCNKYMAPDAGRLIYGDAYADSEKQNVTYGLTPSFEDATRECSINGAIVETPRSPEAESFMFSLAGGRIVSLWLGVMNIANEATWVWNDGAKMTWSDWNGTAEHGDAPLQHCMYAIHSRQGWIKTRCNSNAFPLISDNHGEQQMGYVCGQITCSFPYQVIVAEDSLPFYPDSPFYHKCYRPLFNERLNARQANQFCAEDGSKSNPSRLAAPVNDIEDDILNTQVYLFDNSGLNGYQSKWIGYAYNGAINKFQFNDNYIGYGMYHFWDDGNPNNIWKLKGLNDNPKHWGDLKRKCTIIVSQDDPWTAKNCAYEYGVVCEREQPYVLTTCPTARHHTGLNAHLLGGYYPNVTQSQRMKCYYKHSVTSQMTYADADSFCASLGGYVMMPKQENDLTKAINAIPHTSLSARDNRFWIGADDIGHCYHQDERCTPNPNAFSYLDGSSFTLNNLTWYPGEPAYVAPYKVGCMLAVRGWSWGLQRLVTYHGSRSCFQNNHVVCQVDHNNLRAHRNFDRLIACNGDIGWYPASGDMCYHTPPSKAEVYFYTERTCGRAEPAKPRNKGQMRSLLLSRPKGISTSVIGVFYHTSSTGWKWLEKNWLGFRRGQWGYNWVPGSATNWAPGQPQPNITWKTVKMDENGKWISAYQNILHHFTCEVHGVESLTAWRAAAELSSDEASESDRPHVENTYVAMVIVVSLFIIS